jgi:hypothetical protein
VKQVIELFQAVPEAGVSQLAEPLLGIWWETSFQAQHEWEQLSIAELAQRTAGKWGTTVPGEPVIRV